MRSGGSKPTSAMFCLDQDTLLPESTGNTRPDMTEKDGLFQKHVMLNV